MSSKADTEKLDKAFHYLSARQYADAERICRAIVMRSPRNARAVHYLGLVDYFGGDPSRAIEKLRRAANLDPADTDILYNLGFLATETKKFDEAIVAYQKIRNLNPAHLDALYNLAVIYGEQYRFDEAIQTYNDVIALDPLHARALNNLGLVYLKIGQADRAEQYCRAALDADPAQENALINWMESRCDQAPMADWPRLCDEALAWPVITPENRYLALIQRAAGEAALMADRALEKTLALAFAARPVSGSKRLDNRLIYEDFLRPLLIYRQSNPSLFARQDNTIYLAGESHALTYAGLSLGGSTIQSHLIMGAKAWHIAAETPNKYTVALDVFIKTIPDGATLMAVFGEIDCRTTEGILRHVEKRGGDLDTIVKEQVAAYVAAMQRRAIQKSLKLVFVNVPAPHPASGDRRDIILRFNDALRRETKSRGHRLIDLHNVTAGPDGYGRSDAYLDSFHLKPEWLCHAAGHEMGGHDG